MINKHPQTTAPPQLTLLCNFDEFRTRLSRPILVLLSYFLLCGFYHSYDSSKPWVSVQPLECKMSIMGNVCLWSLNICVVPVLNSKEVCYLTEPKYLTHQSSGSNISNKIPCNRCLERAIFALCIPNRFSWGFLAAFRLVPMDAYLT